MNTRLTGFGLAALCAIALHGAAATAQEKSNHQEIQVYGGELFGDRVTETPIAGSTPRLDDNVTFGARYTYYFTDMWGLQLAGGYSPSRVAHAASGSSNFVLTTVDVDAVWNITPGYRIVGYTIAGVGYARANLDQAIRGTLGGQYIAISDSTSFTSGQPLRARLEHGGNNCGRGMEILSARTRLA